MGITKNIISTCLFSLTLFGCACIDPLEPLNRKIFTFNIAVDRAIFRPVARAYEKVVPAPVCCGIGNFFDNLDDLTNIANNVLQFKLLDAWSDLWRFGLNTTFGLLGLFDVATCAGLPKHHQDFGLTLARYGFVNSSYLMIPIFGPSTLRDTIGWAVDWRYLSVWGYIEPKTLRYSLYGLRLIHKRACLLPADKLIDDALDPYIFVRDAYLQKRDCDIRSICPCNDAVPNDPKSQSPASSKDNEDTFVPESQDSNTKPSTKEEKQTVLKPKCKKEADDPFVAP